MRARGAQDRAWGLFRIRKVKCINDGVLCREDCVASLFFGFPRQNWLQLARRVLPDVAWLPVITLAGSLLFAWLAAPPSALGFGGAQRRGVCDYRSLRCSFPSLPLFFFLGGAC